MFKASIVGGRDSNKNEVKTPVNIMNEIEHLIKNCKKCVKVGSMSHQSAAFCIVSKIRSIYYTTCEKNGDHFDIQTYIYMDQFFFNNLEKLIEGVIMYGGAGVPKSVITTTIKNCIEYVEYKVDIDEIYKVIDVLYAEFVY